MTKIADTLEQAKRTQHELARLLNMAVSTTNEVDVTKLTEQEKRVFGFILQLQNQANDLYALTKFALLTDRIEGYLYRKANGRYCISTNPKYELTSGTLLQYRDEETGIFYTSRLESHDGKYYIFDLGKEYEVEGLYVSVKN